MSAQKNEVQLIPIYQEKEFYSENGYHTKVVSRQKSGSVRRRRKRKRQMKRQMITGALIICAALFIIVCYQTNWFTELPKANKKAQVEQLMTEEHYPQELRKLLEENEESYDFVENYANREDYMGKPIDLSDDFQAGSVPLLMQWDKRWGYDLYGDSMIGLAGCGPTCMTMAYLYQTGDLDMNPRTMAEFAQDSGFHTEEGTSWDFWTLGAEALGLYGEVVSLSENAMKTVLDNGGLLVCSMSAGDFTTGGHYILLRGYDDNGFFVNDPNRKSNSEKQWNYETLAPQIKNLWGIYSGSK